MLNYESTDNAQVESVTIPVLNRASGFIQIYQLKDYQSVTKGQVLLKIDDREYRIAVQQAEAELAAAKAELAGAEAQINNISSNRSVATAGVSIEQVAIDKAKRDLNRDQALFNEGSITRHQLENSSSAYQTALRQVASSLAVVDQVMSIGKGILRINCLRHRTTYGV
ncbi:HlyD family secretion protein [Pedobacter hartonius]|uniref:Membrane fusion protein, multidrug efflux system n=1 Tax=Pedobacter hartonius TaxID=425514 RepID=A0A1H4CSB0_9SPHI|nr:biotin/lipoyl-binding protein [Pedobacter hartonius]SEA63265.1 membrane fusion protein, multidrug efflux system [Pedobacter hartonius]